MADSSRRTPPGPGQKYWRRPLDADRIKVPHGEIHILVNRCKGCQFCVEYCPRDVLEMSESFNVKGYHYPEAVNEGECVNCQLCEMLCPEFAIFCVEVEEEVADDDGGS
ncbi:MAG: 4Fe-4S dicluster domain-containing protein [Candidatus Eisenbacteria bacterium]|nr:4Fe-4S dicluster domain-containing protein [Candidatus Eisenbacteria bacterium]